MKYQRGATGKEVIPNVGFWSSLPGLIKVSMMPHVNFVMRLQYVLKTYI